MSGLLLIAGDTRSWDAPLRFTIAREMMRRWLGLTVRLAGPEGSAHWFTLGFSAHYARALLLRAGLATPAEFLSDLGGSLDRYTASPARNAPNDELQRLSSTSPEHRDLPLARGMLYAAEVDAAIRAKSGGKRSLDDLVLGMLEKTRALVKARADDEPRVELPAGAFRDAVGAELGPAAEARYDAVVVRGETVTPPSEAFGPCFKRVKKSVTRARGERIDGVAWVREPAVPDASCARK